MKPGTVVMERITYQRRFTAKPWAVLVELVWNGNGSTPRYHIDAVIYHEDFEPTGTCPLLGLEYLHFHEYAVPIWVELHSIGADVNEEDFNQITDLISDIFTERMSINDR